MGGEGRGGEGRGGGRGGEGRAGEGRGGEGRGGEGTVHTFHKPEHFFFFFFRYCAGQRFIAALSHNFRVGGGVHDSYTFQCGLVGSFTSPGIDTR